MKIHIKTKYFEIYSDTTRHQLLILLFFSVLWIQFYAWSVGIDSAVWQTTSMVIGGILAFCTGLEVLSRGNQKNRNN